MKMDTFVVNVKKIIIYLRRNDSLCFQNSNNDIYYKCAFTDFKGENCTKCIEGYYLGGEDHKCSLIENCAISENENKCIKCNNGYCFDTKNGICINNEKIVDINKKFYFSCIKTNKEGNACEECIGGFKLNEEGYCINFEDCEEIKNGVCEKCMKFDDKSEFCSNEVFGCIKTNLNNCLKCNNILNLNECSKCIEGYKPRDSEG